jgi:hypothetical protein
MECRSGQNPIIIKLVPVRPFLWLQCHCCHLRLHHQAALKNIHNQEISQGGRTMPGANQATRRS